MFVLVYNKKPEVTLKAFMEAITSLSWAHGQSIKPASVLGGPQRAGGDGSSGEQVAVAGMVPLLPRPL